MVLSKEEIIRRGFVDVHAWVGGIRQHHRLTVKKETTAFGQMPYLFTGANIPANELLRIAEETGLPVRSPTTTVFPKGKGPKDFVTIHP